MVANRSTGSALNTKRTYRSATRSPQPLIPVAAILVVRAMERRFAKAETSALLLAALSVPIGLMAPLMFLGQSFGWLRFFMYPLFVAAGWSVYEVAASRRRSMALAIIAAGWVLAIPATLVCMLHTDIGLQEHAPVSRTLGRTPAQVALAWTLNAPGPRGHDAPGRVVRWSVSCRQACRAASESHCPCGVRSWAVDLTLSHD
jgi:hypothetical protein